MGSKTGFRVGVADPIIAARPAADTFTRASYLGAVANRADSSVTTSTNCSRARCGNRSIAAPPELSRRWTPPWNRGPCWGTSQLAIESVGCDWA